MPERCNQRAAQLILSVGGAAVFFLGALGVVVSAGSPQELPSHAASSTPVSTRTPPTPTPGSELHERFEAYCKAHPEATQLSGHITPPELIESIDPDFNSLHGKRVQLGVHMFAMVVTAEGTVHDPAYLSQRDQSVAGCVLPALRRWRYKPATKGGKSISVVLLIAQFLD